MNASHLNGYIALYSTNTWLAYIIAERYYNGIHYVWCTPHFDPTTVPSIGYTVPPSSSPAEIYRNLHDDVRRADNHSAKIASNRAGLLRGVEIHLNKGKINNHQATEITSIIEASVGRDFRPLVYVIPTQLVVGKVKDVPVSQRAHPLSVEYIIEDLPRNCFDVLDIEGR